MSARPLPGPRPFGPAEALAIVRDAIPTLPRSEVPGLLEQLAGLQALALLRAHAAPEPDASMPISAEQAAQMLKMSRRTLYDQAPSMTCARKAGPRKWEFSLPGLLEEKRKRGIA